MTSAAWLLQAAAPFQSTFSDSRPDLTAPVRIAHPRASSCGKMVGMRVTDLDQDERLALVALMRGIVLADGDVSDGEATIMPKLAEEMGRAAYEEAWNAFGKRFPDEEALKKFLLTIQRQEARELIYATLTGLASVDGVSPTEHSHLKWLEGAWGVKPAAPTQP